ncbi:MAG: VOC family protein [Alloprevotella sp.]
MATYSLHHVGYVVADMEASTRVFQQLGYKAGPVLREEPLSVDLRYLKKAGETLVELVLQHNPESPEQQLLAKNGPMPYHVCYRVDCMEEAVADLEAKGFARLFDPLPVGVLQGQRICYLSHPAMGLVELLSAADPEKVFEFKAGLGNIMSVEIKAER